MKIPGLLQQLCSSFFAIREQQSFWIEAHLVRCLQFISIFYKNRKLLRAFHSVNKQHTSWICGSANSRKKSGSSEWSFYRMIRFQLWPVNNYLISELVQVFNPVGKPRIWQKRQLDRQLFRHQKRTTKIDVDKKRSQFLQKEVYFQIISTFIWTSRLRWGTYLLSRAA